MPQPATEWREWHGLEALYLGEIIVGRVSATGGGRDGSKPRAIFNLAAIESAAFWFDCRSVDEAKSEVERRIEDWLGRAGMK